MLGTFLGVLYLGCRLIPLRHMRWPVPLALSMKLIVWWTATAFWGPVSLYDVRLHLVPPHIPAWNFVTGKQFYPLQISRELHNSCSYFIGFSEPIQVYDLQFLYFLDSFDPKIIAPHFLATAPVRHHYDGSNPVYGTHSFPHAS